MSSPAEGLRALRLLVVERSGWIARSLASVLPAAGWMMVRAEDAGGALDLVGAASPDVILVHGDLGDHQVLELCGRLRQLPQVGRTTPIVVLSAEATRSRRIEALRAGAWDFFAEPLDTEVFLLKLETFAQGRREFERLEGAALVERETGLYNRAGLARRAEEVAADTRRRHAPLSCVVFMPEAPEAAAEAGAAAQHVATWVGSVFRRAGRASDVIARIDGILAVIAPATDADGARKLALRLRSAVRETSGVEAASQPLWLRAGYCAAADFARSTMSVEQMLERAIGVLRRIPDDQSPAAVPGEIVPLASGP